MIILNNKKIEIEKFPNNEIRIRNINNIDVSNSLIEFKYESSDDLIALMFIKNKLDDLNINVKLYIRYMPYSRMDREFDNDLFLLKYICKFINNLNFEKVYVLEPHSKVTEMLLNNVVPIYAMIDFIDHVKNQIGFNEDDSIVFPDEGAYKRYGTNFKNYIIFEKRRDEASTNIKTIGLKQGNIKQNSKCIIIDDLCSTGSTCNMVAKILKENGVNKVYVLVAHTENQALNNDILNDKSYIDFLYTTNSLLTEKHDKVLLLDFNKAKYLV